jgi:hypothetical protein
LPPCYFLLFVFLQLKSHFKKYLSVVFDNPDTGKVRVYYRCFDNNGLELIKLKAKPSAVLLNSTLLKEALTGEGYSWLALEKGGVLTISRKNCNKVIVVE